MPTFPIVVRKKSMLHRQGTKEYHQVLVTNADDKALVIHRWGKARTEGQMKAIQFETGRGGFALFDEKDREKDAEPREFVFINYFFSRLTFTNQVGDPSGLKGVSLGPIGNPVGPMGRLYMTMACGGNLNHVCPELDTAGVKEPEVAEYEEIANGGFVRKGYQPKQRFDGFIEPPKPTIADKIAQDADWGSW